MKRSSAHPPRRNAVAIGAAAGAAAAVHLGLHWMPTLEHAALIRGAAELAGLLSGSPVASAPDGWLLPAAAIPIKVTAACSGADFCGFVAALLAWQLTRRGFRLAAALGLALVAAPPLAIFVNALRFVAVAHVHRWADPLLSAPAAAFAHMLAGAAIFLPALIALNLLLESHARLARAHRP